MAAGCKISHDFTTIQSNLIFQGDQSCHFRDEDQTANKFSSATGSNEICLAARNTTCQRFCSVYRSLSTCGLTVCKNGTSLPLCQLVSLKYEIICKFCWIENKITTVKIKIESKITTVKI